MPSPRSTRARSACSTSATSRGRCRTDLNGLTAHVSSARTDLHAEHAGKAGNGADAEPRATSIFLGFLAGDDRRAHEPAPEALQWLGRKRGNATRGERQMRPLVVTSGRERGEDLPAEPARPDAVPGVAEPVMDARAGHGAEEREMVGRHVDRAAPRSLDPRAGEARQQPAEPPLRARGGRSIGGEPGVEPAAEADRPGAAPHQYPAVLRRPEVVEEHPSVKDR